MILYSRVRSEAFRTPYRSIDSRWIVAWSLKRRARVNRYWQVIPPVALGQSLRVGRFQEFNLFLQLFEEIVARCLEAHLWSRISVRAAGQEITYWSVTAVTDCHLWVRDNKAPLYREQWPGPNGVQQRFRKFLPAGEPSVLYCSAIAPLAPDEGHQGTLCGYVHGSSALKENYSCKARHFPSD